MYFFIFIIFVQLMYDLFMMKIFLVSITFLWWLLWKKNKMADIP